MSVVVSAGDVGSRRNSPGADTKAVLIATRVGAASIDPDTPGVVDGARASNEAGAIEGQVARVVNSPSGRLAVCTALVSTRAGRVLQNALAHARTVGVELLGDAGRRLQVQGTLGEVEGGVVGSRGRRAGRVLGGQVEQEAVLGGGERRELNGRAGAEGDQVEGLAAGRTVGLAVLKMGSGGGARSEGSSKDLELHGDCWKSRSEDGRSCRLLMIVWYGCSVESE